LQPDCFNANDPLNFNICLDITSETGQVDERYWPSVLAAKERWERIIATDRWGPWSGAAVTGLNSDYVGTEVPATLDDIYIAVIVRPLPGGAGGRYAEAGPDRQTGNLEIVASSIILDSVDIDTAVRDGIMDELVLHEMGHCLGLGTNWDLAGVVSGSTYTGANGVQGWRDVGCTGDLPLDTGGHWSESCLSIELMTPTLRTNFDYSVSAVTMGSLEDLGYTVNRNEQDDLPLSVLGGCGDSCPAAGRQRQRRLGHSSKGGLPAPAMTLSQEAESSLLQAAADRFRDQDHRLVHTDPVSSDTEFLPSTSVSFGYMENGHYFSRVIHRRQVEHLI